MSNFPIYTIPEWPEYEAELTSRAPSPVPTINTVTRPSTLFQKRFGSETSFGTRMVDPDAIFQNRHSNLMPVQSRLVGIALVVRSKDGPRFIFHFPPRMQNEKGEKPRYGTELDPTTPDPSDDEEEDDDDNPEDNEYLLNNDFESLGLGGKDRHVNPWDGDEHFELADGTHIVPWEHLDAFETKDLAGILTPHRDYHKKLFELSLDPVTYVSYPIHIREDGKWKKEKKEKKRKKDRDYSDNADEVGTVSKDDQGSAPVPVPPTASTKGNDKSAAGGSFVSDDGSDQGGMTMFNLVFIMNCKRTEKASRVYDMFEHVAKDMNKALRYAQNYSNYVWKESEMILSMKDKAREERISMSTLWASILEKSSLARAMKTTFQSISKNEIAVVHLASEPPVRLSVQIPQPSFLYMPPDFNEVGMPGLLITSANPLRDPDGDESSVLNKYFGLLLLDEEEKIIADIQADGGELAGPLLEYLKVVKPTLSFHQTAQQHGISLSDIRILAQHLIYHKRALAIPPLHARDTYILSPNSPNDLLRRTSASWARLFPLAPPLPVFLSTLSLVPRPYKTHIPSKPHRPLYLSMLAFLLRTGFVTQLRTFSWIIVWPELRYEIQHALDGERLRHAVEDANQDAIEDALTSAADSTPLSSEAQAEKARLSRLRAKAKQDLSDFNALPLPIATPTPENPQIGPSNNDAVHLLALEPHIIKDPRRADHVDSLYLAAIAKRFKDERSRKGFLRYAKYFDGKTALEDVALLEGVRRKEAWILMVEWEEFLLTVKHW